MSPGEQLLKDLAGAVLDGAPVDWAAAESTADAAARPLVRHLRLVASVAQVHGQLLPVETETWRAPSADALADNRWGHLRLHERIGRGAFGEVFRAWDTRLDREVALKLLPAARANAGAAGSTFIREGRLLARVRHPNVVTIYGAEQIGDRIGLWMEFVRGRTLEHQLRHGEGFQPADVARIGIELARAVTAVHAAGLLHRDIKAQNVMQADDGRVVLMDFGAGSELAEGGAGGGAGTPLYLAPEVLAGGAATVQSDLYSLGVLLYHLATRAYPVTGRTVHEVRQAHAQGRRIPLRQICPEVRPALARAIERASDPRPERRHESADALARDLLALQQRPVLRRLAYGLAAAAAVLGIALVASEVRARLDPSHRSVGRRLAGLVAGAPSPLEQPAIAVLPFRNVGEEPGSDLLVDSITAGLIRQLAVIDGLQVRSQASSFLLRDARDPEQVGRRLNVNLVVDGEALLSGGTLLIKASLISTQGHGQLWSDTIDRQIATERDLAGALEDLTRTIVNRLRLKLGRTQRRYDTDIQTLTTYLRARRLRDGRAQRASEAIPLFQEVIEKDPSFAPGLAALAATYGTRTFTYPEVVGHSLPLAEALRLMEPLTVKALQIDPMLAEAHAAMGLMHSIALRWEAAEASFRRAIDLDPSLTSVHADFVLSTLRPWGRHDEAIALLEDALRSDPLSLDLRRVLANTQLMAGRYDDAIENCRRVMDVDPDFPFTSMFRARALLFKGLLGEARSALSESRGRNEGWIAYIDAISGRRAEAEAIAARNASLPQRQAIIYAGLGDADRAWEALERLAAVNPGRAASYLANPELAVLRGDSRYEAFRQKLRFPHR